MKLASLFASDPARHDGVRQAREDLYIQPRVRQADRDEIESATRGEHTVGGRERHMPGARQPRGDPHEVLLRHADVHEALRKRITERKDVRVFAEIGGQAHDLRPLPGELGSTVPAKRTFGLRSLRGYSNSAGESCR